MSRISGVIFDMDGVLINSEPLWWEAISHTFSKFGYSLPIQVQSETQGMGIRKSCEWIYTHICEITPTLEMIHQAEETIYSLQFQLTRDKNASGQLVFEGIPKLLHSIQNAGIPIALASGANMEMIRTLMRITELEKYFRIFHSGELESRGKPYPDIFLTAAKLIESDPNFCVVIEDSINGVIAGKSAGMKVLACPGKEQKWDIRYHQADKIFDSVNDITLDDILGITYA